jgi:hypothetical protein
VNEYGNNSYHYSCQTENNDIDNNNSYENDENTLSQSSDLFQLSKTSKKWRSMCAFRDSIRNLTSCVVSRSHLNK